MPTRATRTLAIVAISAVILAVGGCVGGGRATGSPEQSTQTLSVGGVTRSFHIYRPADISGPAPLVVMLHGGYGTGAQAERAYRWDAQADAGHFVVVYPDGLNRAWNAGSCCGLPARSGVDDVAFLSAMVGAIEQQMPIDTSRVFATGMSNGAMMALRLACQSSLFAAVAPVAGTLLTGCSGASPTSVLQIHGTADDRVPYGGGPGPRVDGPSVESVNATWRTIDGCEPPVSSSDGDVTTQRADCPDGRAVELITIAGAGHQWPGDATATIWRFFTQHHL
ncbi:polyhydroxybutyrate depolymerase [Mycolicibacterium sp. BK556]|uniref:alpha/beta hydrolase family esterase n=1 Tax=unclassified Mycolicibacterium TaxID=2636767 RepID=UPI001613F3DA|nr:MULTISPECIES: PHB depolymerase family esterase [unclassified Mycolicibacterium]MBB3606746.1 polyhydroxybutyrate depolymerase [Mycolicibacterium sp. BK556]MBB3636588.1 polyhydroxybutyrate depolymerase [Mycolicibacterium sp. BK607]